MTVYLKDYRAPDYTISHIDLKLELDEEATIVTSTLFINKNNLNTSNPLVLNGGNFELLAIKLNDIDLSQDNYTIIDNQLTLLAAPTAPFTLNIVNKINPKANTELTGLYKAGEILTTHCEAEGFRNITFFLDRPDVLATYTTEIHADKTKYPVLLANGNLKFFGPHPLDSRKHIFIYDDPIPKPSYLFATVAGNFGVNEDYFITMSNRKISLRIFVPHADLPKTTHAMTALKAAMKFDEEHYDREYDLDIYNIVGVPQFNAGAMENKGLNIFNNSSLLVDPATATDSDFEWVYSCVGHEYFHNWRGNRVTVKQWFELSLKEGFATITEQEFSQTLTQSLVSRINDIRRLQSRQFAIDNGPLAQAVRPAEYEATSNLYTWTIYLKGAELLNMLKNMLGDATFRKGCNFYFAKNDSKAADIEAFLKAMEEASGRDLSQFLLWYEQEGTPELHFDANYDANAKTYTLTVKQTCPPTPNQPHKKPLPVPIAIALLNSKTGEEMLLQLEGETLPPAQTRILELNKESDTFTFVGVEEKPVPSLMRNFSAPVKIISTPLSNDDYKFLLNADSDQVNSWLAGFTLTKNAILSIIADLKANKEPSVDIDLLEKYDHTLTGFLLDARIPADKHAGFSYVGKIYPPVHMIRLMTELLTFPPVSYFFEYVNPVDPDLIQQARDFFINQFIKYSYDILWAIYASYSAIQMSDDYSPLDASYRALKNLCLSYLMKANTPEANEYCKKQLETAKNMTDTLGALKPLATFASKEREELRQQALAAFQDKWQHDAVAIEYLFNMYATSEQPDALDQIIAISKSPVFNKENPSHVWALFSKFYLLNPCVFHDPSGRAYKFFADTIIELDKINSATAAELVPAFECWQKMEPVRQEKMLTQLMRLHALPLRPEDAKQQTPGVIYLSSEVKELVSKNVKAALEVKPVVSGNSFGIFAKEEKTKEEIPEQRQVANFS